MPADGQVSESGTHDTTYDDVVSITVTAPAEPDLTAYVALSNTKVGAGGSLAVSLYDINLGDGAPGASTTALYLSISPTINSSDTLLTTTSVGSLSAACSIFTPKCRLSKPRGLFYHGNRILPSQRGAERRRRNDGFGDD